MFMLYDDAEINRIALCDAEKQGLEQGKEESLLESLKAVMESMSINMDKAMDILKIPADKRDSLRTRLVS